MVRAKFYPSEKKRCSYNSGNFQCQVCNNIKEIDTFTSTVISESFKLNHDLCCNDKFFIYPLTCKICKKKYTGKTVNRLTLYRNNYKESDRKSVTGEEIQQKSFHQHFLKDDHHSSEEDVSICLIDKTDPHKVEYYWSRTLKTIANFGRNAKEIH